ncbi:unnamed protein product [Schistosoma curassoni]|uniref:Secreted protein n=1 Tax=Schistosoma curassoni TaxID=6186 RepID=A0A183K8K1_9TREM|nr:unnamed protein product [Schistosoma curassoni]
MWSIFAVTAASTFSASAGMLSGPVALPLLVCLMVMLISSIVSGPTLIGESVGVASMFGLPSKWSSPLFDVSQRLTAAYRRIALQHHCNRWQAHNLG